MEVSDLVDAVSRLWHGCEGTPARATLLELRDQVGRASSDKSFVKDCLRRSLANDESGEDFSLLARDRNLRFEYRLFFWPPRMGSVPHEHVGWTVSAVLVSSLKVVVFDVDAASERGVLEVSRTFDASTGEAGYIFGHGIHAPFNPFDVWAVTFHVLWEGDRPLLDDRRVPGLEAVPRLVPTGRPWWQPARPFFPPNGYATLIFDPDVAVMGSRARRSAALEILRSLD